MLKNNKGSFLVLSLIATATVLGVATYLYSSNYLNTKEEPNTSKEEVSMNDETVLSEVNQRNLAQAAKPTPPTPGAVKPAPIVEAPVMYWVGVTKAKPGAKGEVIQDVYYNLTASTPKAKLELTSILNKIRKDTYLTTALCPFNEKCNNFNNINLWSSYGNKFVVNVICPSSQPLYSAWVIVKDRKLRNDLPSGSTQLSQFLSQSTWGVQLAPLDFRLVDCKSFSGGRSGPSNTNPNIIGGVDITNLTRE